MLFDTIVLLGCSLQIVNMWEIGRGRIHYLLMMVIYSLFAISEGWVAVEDNRTAYWLFVALSAFGALQGARGYVRTKNLYNRRTVGDAKIHRSLYKDVDEENERGPDAACG
jgi:hypothetical protein